MHTTTVRFAGETWAELKEICEQQGIATAQYIREATVARLAQSARSPRWERQDRALEDLRGRVEQIERALMRRARP